MTEKKPTTIERAQKGKDNPYFLSARQPAQNKDLSWEARGLLWYLLSKPDDWKVQITDLKQGCGRDKVYNILNELKAHGYLEYVEERKQGKVVNTYYLVHETPFTEKPETVTPDTVNQEGLNTTEVLENTEITEQDSAVAALGDTPDNSPENNSIKEDKKARKERLDQLFEIIALGSFGKPYAALNGQRGRAGEIRKLLLEENPDITPEYLKAGYARYFEANPTIKHDPSKRMKKASVIIDWCEQAADCITPVLLEPDKDCPKCRGLGYWIDKSNPNNHQSIDCECRSKQRVKS